MLDNKGANDLTIKDIEEFLNTEGAVSPAAEEGQDNTPDDTQRIENTKAFANRLKEATTKARAEEREKIAKDLGFNTFDEMQKARESALLEEKGLDPTEVAPVIEELLQKRLSEDPRLQELEEFRQQKVNEWAKKELAEITELTGGKITKMEQLPKDVVNLWKQKGSLKAAYLELEGERLIKEMRAGIVGGQSKGSAGHLNSPLGAPVPNVIKGNTRPFTDYEKKIYRDFNPKVTDEELNKLRKEI